MSDAPERIWAFYTPDDFEDGATITAYEQVQHGGQLYVRADLHTALTAERDALREALEEIAAPAAFGMRPEDRVEGIRDLAKDALRCRPERTDR